MIASDYLVNVLVKHHVTDVFGIPGGVILDFLYALDRKEGITPHLSYHEQAAAFAASGYAQVSGQLGVAYSTRGPGFANMVTAIADAYCDSIPVLFLTAHSGSLNPTVRLQSNQEIDTCAMVRNVTKYARRIDKIEDFAVNVNEACSAALEGRKGPVFLDIASSLWKKDIPSYYDRVKEVVESPNYSGIINTIVKELKSSKRPVILIGDGINQTNTGSSLRAFVNNVKVPVISSRYAHHTIADSPYYCGYIGGFGVRYANFILSKTDLIISLGNRLNFPITSESYKDIPYQARIIRIDTDKAELQREIPNSLRIVADLRELLPILSSRIIERYPKNEWLEVCNIIKNELWEEDVNEVVKAVEIILGSMPEGTPVLNDVGNNEFWISRACANFCYKGPVLYSKSFATLGSSLVKAIGTYYANKKNVLCFIGDQGFQMNIQELQYIAQHKLPITIVVMNNSVSGMIRDKENMAFKGITLHSTSKDGYEIPDLKKIAQAYGIDYQEIDSNSMIRGIGVSNKPLLINLNIDDKLSLSPTLPRGNVPQDMVPKLKESRYNYINSL